MFPGQGSQKLGMADDVKDVPGAAARLARAEEVLGWSVLDLCQSDEHQLARTLYTQPCLFVVEAILIDGLLARVREASPQENRQPALVAGHSLGEYAALYAAGVFDFETGLRLVQQRAALMDAATGGKMAALIGCDRPQLEAALAAIPEVVLANDNSDAQVVISGPPASIDAVLSQVKAKRTVPLNVSGAFHSPLMAEAAAQFQTTLEAASFADARWPVLSNTEPVPEQSGTALKARLSRQMTGSVRWRETMAYLNEADLEAVVEVGPGQVLAGLCKRGCPNLERRHVSTATEVAAY